MAESFQAVTTSLNEAERVNGKKQWSIDDYERHKSRHNNIDMTRSYLNDAIISAGGRSEKEVVNDYFKDKMEKLNNEYKAEIDAWNDEHVGQMHAVKDRKTGEMVDKPYKKKSVDKRRMYPVGKYEKTGKRKTPYEVLKQSIEKGNARAKPDDSTHMRTGVLQQYIVGWGNSEEWQKGQRYYLSEAIKGKNESSEKAKQLFEDVYVKPFLKQFQQENPSLHLVQAVVQYDETNPHLHMTVLPHIDNDKNAGLGSTAFSDVLKNDHPDYDKYRTFDDFYRHQHEVIKNRLKTADYTNHPLFQNRKAGVALGVGKPLKRTSKAPSRTNLVNKSIEDKEKQIVWAAEWTKKLNKREAELQDREKKVEQNDKSVNKRLNKAKEESIDVIKQLSPKHTVPKERLNHDEEAQPIETTAGIDQHKRQSFVWLHRLAYKLLQTAQARTRELKDQWLKRKDELDKRERDIEALKSQNEQKIKKDYDKSQKQLTKRFNDGNAQLQQREQQVFNRESNVETSEDNVKSREDAATKRENDVLKRESDVNQKETDLSKREEALKSKYELTNKINEDNLKFLKIGLHMFHPKAQPSELDGLAKGQLFYHNKTGMELLMHEVQDINTPPNFKKNFNAYVNGQDGKDLLNNLSKGIKDINKDEGLGR